MPQEPLAQLEPQVILETLVQQALQALQGLQGPLERQVLQVQLALKDQRVRLVLQDLRDLQVQLVLQEQRVQQDLELLQAEQPIHF